MLFLGNEVRAETAAFRDAQFPSAAPGVEVAWPLLSPPARASEPQWRGSKRLPSEATNSSAGLSSK